MAHRRASIRFQPLPLTVCITIMLGLSVHVFAAFGPFLALEIRRSVFAVAHAPEAGCFAMQRGASRRIIGA